MQISAEKIKKFLKLIGDDLCVKILLEIEKSDIYSDALAEKLGMPKSTVWTKINELEETGIIESYSSTAEVGKRVKMYRFKNQTVDFKTVSDILRIFEKE